MSSSIASITSSDNAKAMMAAEPPLADSNKIWQQATDSGGGGSLQSCWTHKQEVMSETVTCTVPSSNAGPNRSGRNIGIHTASVTMISNNNNTVSMLNNNNNNNNVAGLSLSYGGCGDLNKSEVPTSKHPEIFLNNNHLQSATGISNSFSSKGEHTEKVANEVDTEQFHQNLHHSENWRNASPAKTRGGSWRDQMIIRDSSLVSRENSLIERSNSLVGRDHSVVERSNSLIARDNSVVERSNSLIARDNSVVERSNSLVG